MTDGALLNLVQCKACSTPSRTHTLTHDMHTAECRDVYLIDVPFTVPVHVPQHHPRLHNSHIRAATHVRQRGLLSSGLEQPRHCS
jgi:hypothetical protein